MTTETFSGKTKKEKHYVVSGKTKNEKHYVIKACLGISEVKFHGPCLNPPLNGGPC